MSSKRKHNTVRFESSSTHKTQNKSATTARTITVGHGTSGRLTQQSEVSEVEISLEDLAILQQAPEFAFNASNLIDFEQAVQADIGESEDQSNVELHVVQETPKTRVSTKTNLAVLLADTLDQIDPNISWLPFRSEQLDELIRHDGRAGLTDHCVSCDNGNGDYRCKDCFGPRAQCRNCLLRDHQWLPFHRIQVCLSKISNICVLTNFS